MKKLKKVIAIMLLISILGCVNDKDFDVPIITCEEPVISATNTIQQVKDMYTFGGATTIDSDVIIEGYVNSSDEDGNIYKSISIQDHPENPTSAIRISIDKSNLYTKYNVGRKIFIKLKGLAVGYSYGSIQIGKVQGEDLGRIPSTELNTYIIRSCEVAEIIPKEVVISELNESHLEMLINIQHVQFREVDLGKSYANVDNTETVDRILENFNEDCSLKDEIKLRNSGYAVFKNELLPEGKGSVTAILSNYYEDFQLYIRNVEDVNFSEERCTYSNVLTPTKTLNQIKEMYTGTMVEFGNQEECIVEGFVVSSDKEGNMQHKLVLQDAIENPTAGIQLLLDKEAIFENFEIGSKVFVNLNKLYMNKENGVLVIGFPKNGEIVAINETQISDFVFHTGEVAEIIPAEMSIADIYNPNFENTLVKIMNVQLVENELGKAYAFFSGTDDASRTLETCSETNKLIVFTNGEASFATEIFPQGKGSISGVLNNGQLEIRAVNDVNFNLPFETCPVIIPKIMITEIADPKNSTTSRFVELYNAGDTAMNLTGWKLNKYVNGATSVSSGAILLDGFVLEPGAFLIVANTGFASIFNSTPTIESTYISGNGDDVYELVDNSGNRIDIFGVIGEDGTGTNWEYVDGGVVRNIAVILPNNVFNISEWEVSSNASNFLISYPNTPKNAPNDYSPNYR